LGQVRGFGTPHPPPPPTVGGGNPRWGQTLFLPVFGRGGGRGEQLIESVAGGGKGGGKVCHPRGGGGGGGGDRRWGEKDSKAHRCQHGSFPALTGRAPNRPVNLSSFFCTAIHRGPFSKTTPPFFSPPGGGKKIFGQVIVVQTFFPIFLGPLFPPPANPIGAFKFAIYQGGAFQVV